MIYNPWNQTLFLASPDDCHPDFELGGGDYLVDATGYESPDAVIYRLMSAGVELDAFNREQFPDDYNHDDPDTFNEQLNPAADLGYDFFDYHRDLTLLRQRLTDEQRKTNTGVDQSFNPDSITQPWKDDPPSADDTTSTPEPEAS